MVTDTTCKNCGCHFQGNFCPQCGQKSATHEIDSRFIFHEVPHAIFHIDKGIFYTLKELTIRPGKTVLEYIHGKRIRHFSPIAYIIILSSVFLFVNSLYDGHGDVTVTTNNEHLQEKLVHMLGFIFLSFTPVFAFFYWLFFHKKSHLNYWKFLVASTFFIGHGIVLLILSRVLFPSNYGETSLQGSVLTPIFIYIMFCYYQLLRGFYSNRIIMVLKLLIALSLSLAFCVFVFVGYVLVMEQMMK